MTGPRHPNIVRAHIAEGFLVNLTVSHIGGKAYQRQFYKNTGQTKIKITFRCNCKRCPCGVLAKICSSCPFRRRLRGYVTVFLEDLSKIFLRMAVLAFKPIRSFIVP
jgi:hypothetical protein